MSRRPESTPRLHETLPLINWADLCEQEGSGVLQKTGPIMSRRPEPEPRLHETLPLINWADLCEQEGSGGVAEDRANHVQEARVNASLGMGLSMP
jgi:hypothetical protein